MSGNRNSNADRELSRVAPMRIINFIGFLVSTYFNAVVFFPVGVLIGKNMVDNGRVNIFNDNWDRAILTIAFSLLFGVISQLLLAPLYRRTKNQVLAYNLRMADNLLNVIGCTMTLDFLIGSNLISSTKTFAISTFTNPLNLVIIGISIMFSIMVIKTTEQSDVEVSIADVAAGKGGSSGGGGKGSGGGGDNK